jgi:tRNA(Ile)-lysidine synthase TilS/MesJ
MRKSGLEKYPLEKACRKGKMLPLMEKQHIFSLPRPPWPGVGRRIESLCRKAIHEFDLLAGVDKLAVALSGGKDSLSLLFMLHAIKGRGVPDFDLIAIHVDGEFSCGAGISLRYLEGICDALQIPFIQRRSTLSRESLECYSCSRIRRKLIFEAAKDAGAHHIAFGHHQDDTAQTVLMNLLHKAEFAAMLPKLKMIDYGVTILRPLLLVKEDMIRSFAKERGFSRVTCQCPVGQSSLRKKAEVVLKQLEEVFPNARSNLASAGQHYGSDKATRK